MELLSEESWRRRHGLSESVTYVDPIVCRASSGWLSDEWEATGPTGPYRGCSDSQPRVMCVSLLCLPNKTNETPTSHSLWAPEEQVHVSSGAHYCFSVLMFVAANCPPSCLVPVLVLLCFSWIGPRGSVCQLTYAHQPYGVSISCKFAAHPTSPPAQCLQAPQHAGKRALHAGS